MTKRKMLLLLLVLLLLFTSCQNTSSLEHNDSISSSGMNGEVYAPLVSADQVSSYYVDESGVLWAWGVPDAGENDTVRPISLAQDVIAVSAGSGSLYYLTGDGALWAWDFSLDVGRIDEDVPRQIRQNVRSIQSFEYELGLVDDDGRAYLWRRRPSEEEDILTEVNLKDVRAVIPRAYEGGYVLQEDGTLSRWDRIYPEMADKPIDITRMSPVMTEVSEVEVGYAGAYALKEDGSLWAWGQTPYGVSGVSRLYGDEPVCVLEDVADVSVGSASGIDLYEHVLALRKDGSLWSMGCNEFGQLGSGDLQGRDTFIEVLSDVQAIAAGGMHSLVLMRDGALKAWGNNDNGQLGIGARTDLRQPHKLMDNVVDIAASSSLMLSSFVPSHSLALQADGSLWGWGSNQNGQLGLPDLGWQLQPRRIRGGIVDIAAGYRHSLWLSEQGSAFFSGSVARERASEMAVAAPAADRVEAGAGMSALIDSEGNLYLWKNDMPPYSRTEILTEDVAEVDLAYQHATILKKDGSLWGWGANESGQLAQSSIFTDNGFVTYSEPVHIMDDVIDLAAGGALAHGGIYGFSVALRDDGSVWAWGRYGNHLWEYDPQTVWQPQQIFADAVAVSAGARHLMVIDRASDLYLLGGEYESFTKVFSGAVQAVEGCGHFMVLDTEQNLWVWGRNNSAQLGIGTYRAQPLPQSIDRNFFTADEARR